MANKELIWAFMMKMGSNMWGKKGQIWPFGMEDIEMLYHEDGYCDRKVWREVTDFLPQFGINTLLIDVGEGIRLTSHPELANRSSWTQEEVKAEIKRLKGMGITPIPKLNFSCCHDAWLQDYAYMVGTETYNRVCEEILSEVIDIFDRPKFFHLGLDEERVENQMHSPVTRIRAPYKRLEDALRLFETCRRKGVRPWMWCDFEVVEGFGGDEEFCRTIPKDVLLSNAYYNDIYRTQGPSKRAQLYGKLGDWGYEQIPTCSRWFSIWNPRHTLRYCTETVNPDSIIGYMDAPWLFSVEEHKYGLMNDAQLFGYAKRKYYPEQH